MPLPNLAIQSLHQLQKGCSDCLSVADGSFSRADNDLKANRKFVLLQAKGFANSTLPSVANHSVSDLFAYRQTKPGTGVASSGSNYQHIVGSKMIFLEHTIEINAREQALLFFEKQFFGHANGPSQQVL